MLSTSLDELIERCAGGEQPVAIITRTRRLARALRLRVAQCRGRDGVAVGEAPQIGTLAQSMAQLADRIAPGRLLLGEAVERALWESAIAQAGGAEVESALDLGSLADTAREAFERLCLWGEPAWDLEPLSRDAAAFRKWLELFRRRLAASKWVVHAELPLLFASLVERGEFDDARPASIALVGFERLEPVVARIATALADAGSEVMILAAPAEPAGTLTVRSARSRGDEVRAVAREIHARLLADSRLRIGVLAPDVSGMRALLERVLEEEMEASAVIGGGTAGARCFEVSAAPPMTAQPLVAHALDLLSLSNEGVSFELASRVLLAPYPRLVSHEASASDGSGDVAGGRGDPAGDEETEREARALAEVELRRGHLARVPLPVLATIARRTGAPRFASALERLSARLHREPASDGPGGWRVRFIHRLDAMQWPGVIDSEIEGLLFRRWQDVLAELASLEVLRSSMTARQALAQLRTICAATTVQASSEGPPVQAMGLLDAAGLQFDVIYAIGMTSTAFPAPAQPNPLLPILWQRTARHPRASAEGEREFAELVWRRVRASAPEVIASFAACDEQGEQKSASALLLPSAGAQLAGDPIAAAPWWAAQAGADRFREAYPASVPAAALSRRGSARLITDQAACPFCAFAAHRLGAEPLAPVQVQPNAALRGSLVHAALEDVYRNVRDQGALARLTDANLQTLVAHAADVALEGKGVVLDAAMAGFARQWLIELVANWLAFEKQDRIGAWSIEEIERPREVRLPRDDERGIEFHVRLDRIDRLESGGLLLIDFKTSSVEKNSTRWAGERPEEPQLPLYATLLASDGNRVEGLAFANLAARDKCSMVGIASTPLGEKLGPAPRRSAFSGDFATDLASMQQCIDALARDYLAGRAAIAPRKPSVCKTCGRQSLCRVFENGASNDEEEAAES